MISKLVLSHFILVESAEIVFDPHFNIVTGETGAGKTAIMQALCLAVGARADTSLIRQGSQKAVVQAAFDISSLPSLYPLLENAGIDFDPKEELIIRREITREGKNRVFINCQLIALPFLQKIGSRLIDFVGTDALHALRTSEFQRSLLDTYANLHDTLSRFQRAFEEEKRLYARYEALQTKEQGREKQEELLRQELEEIESVNCKEAEEETLFQELQRITHSQEINEKLKEILDRLINTPSAVLLQLNRMEKSLESLLKIDPNFSEPCTLIQQALLSLQEAHLQLNSFFTKQQLDPYTIERLENRLASITKLKKKYGKTLGEIQAYKEKILHELSQYDTLSVNFQEVQQTLVEAQAVTTGYAQLLTSQREQAARQLEIQLSEHLQSLNMSKAQVKIALSAQGRTLEGEDHVQFWLIANPGENPSLVREHASGVELSRLFLAIKLVLAHKNQTPTLIFDEIDANIGGKTASIIGEKLAELGSVRQVLCITHFPQVAAKASSHICVRKELHEERTVTQITLLTPKMRQEELLRMLGGEKIEIQSNSTA